MYSIEQSEFTESEVYAWIQESADDPGAIQLRTELIEPVIQVLNQPKNMKRYIQYGSDFLESNAVMLSKQYPTSKVSFPRKYVDGVLELFGFTVSDIKALIRNLLRKYIDESKSFDSIVANPTNVIHTIVLVYTDMLTDPAQVSGDRNNLRDSARQQLGLSIYSSIFNIFFHPPHPDPSVMEYTYMHLDRSWNLVKDEDMITWIGETVETCYASWRTKMSLELSPQILANFLNRVRTSFFQNVRGLANRYFKDIDEGNTVGTDTTGDDEHVEKKEFVQIRNNLVRRISGGDEMYKRKGDLYKVIANWKNVKIDTLYELAQKVDKKDIGDIIDKILYVFITKEGNRIEDINSSKYIARITKFPTAIDRAIQGKPVIVPMSQKYESDASIIKAYICLIATYIMQRLNDVLQH